MNIKIYPSKLIGTLNAPSSKAYSQRMIIAAALAGGVSEISNLTVSKDISVSAAAMEALGATVHADEDTFTISGIKNPPAKADIDCCESGATLRFVIPIAAALGTESMFKGQGKLPQRPITPYIRELSAKGITFEPQGGLPLHMSGKLLPGEYKMEGDISSQFITGLLYALPLCQEDSSVKLTSVLQSKPYVDMTITALKKFGVEIEETEENGLLVYNVKGGQKYTHCNISVEGDYSQAAFFYVANALGSEIEIKNLDPDTAQGDKAIVDIINGCGKELKPFTADVGDIPDLVPILTVLGCLTKGTSRIINAARLKIKESDRLVDVARALNGIGGKVTAGDDFLEIQPVEKFTGGEVDACNDHRIVMSAAIAALSSDSPVIIKGAEAVNKSYPRFFEDYKALGGKFEVL